METAKPTTMEAAVKSATTKSRLRQSGQRDGKQHRHQGQRQAPFHDPPPVSSEASLAPDQSNRSGPGATERFIKINALFFRRPTLINFN
jgi:hypothetical protein